jgi:hypothetical protein
VLAQRTAHRPAGGWPYLAAKVNLQLHREADDETVRISRVFVDTSEALHEAGDLVQPIGNGAIAESHLLGTLWQLAKSAVGGRAGEEEITFKAWLGPRGPRGCDDGVRTAVQLRSRPPRPSG